MTTDRQAEGEEEDEGEVKATITIVTTTTITAKATTKTLSTTPVNRGAAGPVAPTLTSAVSVPK